MGNSEGAGEGRVVIPSPSMSRGSESTITGTGKEVEDMGSGEATCGKGKTFFDDVFCDTRLVELVSTLSSKVEDKPEGGSSQCPSGVGRVKKVGQGELQDAEGANASILNASPDAPTAKPNPKCKSATGMEFGKGAGQRAGGSNEEGTLSWGEKRKEDAGVSKRAITKVGKGVYAGSWSSFDEDIPDDQWRRPMVTYGQRGPRSVSRRRRSMGRSVAQDIAIISPAMKKLRQGSAPGHSLGQGEGQGQEQKLLDGGKITPTLHSSLSNLTEAQLGGGEGQGSHLRQSPHRVSMSKAERSWLALRDNIHRRYRMCEYNSTAKDTLEKVSGVTGHTVGNEVPGFWIFPRQEHAFTCINALEDQLGASRAGCFKVFSYETNSAGRRRFMVCDLEIFQDRYLRPLAEPLSKGLHLCGNVHMTGDEGGTKPVVKKANGGLPIITMPPNRGPGSPTKGYRQSSANATSQCSSQSSDSNPSLPATSKGHASAPLGTMENRPEAWQGSGIRLGPVGGGGMAGEATPSPTCLRHVYEIIREGMPCRMYFDLEFRKALNPGLDGEALVKTWINVVAGKLYLDFGVVVEESDFLDLDSSTPKKFSRHVVLHMPGGQLFANNSHVGRFVNELAFELRDVGLPPLVQPEPPVRANPPSTRELSPAKSPGWIEPTVEQSPAQVLSPCGPGQSSDEVPSSQPTTEQMGSPVKSCLMCCLQGGSKVGEEGGSRCSGTLTPSQQLLSGGSASLSASAAGIGGSEVGGRGAVEQLWVCAEEGRRTLFADVSVYTRNRCFRLLGSSKHGKTATLQVARSNQRTARHMAAIQNHLVAKGVQTPVGSMEIAKMLLVGNNRWCLNIGRQHKSNHVYYVTDLLRREVRQRCHDQDCRIIGYASPPFPLPLEAGPDAEDLETYELELGVSQAMRTDPNRWAAVS